MTTRLSTDLLFQPAVRICSADCTDSGPAIAAFRWTVSIGGAAPGLPVAWCANPSLLNHGYLHWRITGLLDVQTDTTDITVIPANSTAIGTPIASATGLTPATPKFSAVPIGVHFFVMDIKMDVIGTTVVADYKNQMWTFNMKAMNSTTGAVTYTGTEMTALTNIDPAVDQDIGLLITFADTPAGGTSVLGATSEIKSVVCLHYAQRNGSF